MSLLFWLRILIFFFFLMSRMSCSWLLFRQETIFSLVLQAPCIGDFGERFFRLCFKFLAQTDFYANVFARAHLKERMSTYPFYFYANVYAQADLDECCICPPLLSCSLTLSNVSAIEVPLHLGLHPAAFSFFGKSAFRCMDCDYDLIASMP